MRWVRPPAQSEDDGEQDGRFMFGRRVIDVSDVQEILSILEREYDEVAIFRAYGFSDVLNEVHGDLLAEHPSTYDGLALVGRVKTDSGSIDGLVIRFGQKIPAHMTFNERWLLEQGVPGDKIASLSICRWQAANVILRSDPLTPVWVWHVVAQILVWVLLLALAAWFTVTAWPRVPFVVLGLLALIPIERLLRDKTTTFFDRRGESQPRVVLRASTREADRAARYNSKRDWKVGVITGAGAALVSAVATYLATRH